MHLRHLATLCVNTELKSETKKIFKAKAEKGIAEDEKAENNRKNENAC